MSSSFLVVAFYKFVVVNDVLKLQQDLRALCAEHKIFGTILLAEEGINATVASSDLGIQALQNFLAKIPAFDNLTYKFSKSDFLPFDKMKILYKKEIVTFDSNKNMIDTLDTNAAGNTTSTVNYSSNIDPSKKTGKYVQPEAWNDLISEPDILVIDTRNDFEFELGTFQNAVNPMTQKFSDFKAFVQEKLQPNKHKKIAMFCTGGIRCEKASAYLLEEGFLEVYQLEGGILNYLEKIPNESSLWEGECFIFDKRKVLKKEDIKTIS